MCVPAFFFTGVFTMGGHSSRSCTSYEKVPVIIPPAPKLRISGNPDPDSTGDYFEDGLFAGLMSYKNDSNTFFVFWDDDNGTYIIGAVKGVYDSLAWASSTGLLVAEYLPATLDVEGTATVNLL